MGAIPAGFLPPRELWPDRVYTLPEHARYPARLNSTEELIDRQVEAGHGDRVALLYEDQRMTYRELQAATSRLGSALRALGVEGRTGSCSGRPRSPRPSYKWPRDVAFVPQLPQAPGPAGPGTGKLLRRVLREQAERV